jgi:hypothetical protein
MVEYFMTNDWHELTDLTEDRRFLVTEVRMNSGISIQGEFELPPLARLRYEDQVFVSEFVRSHGSIKDMEKAFGISYPTVKNRLNRIIDQLQLVEVTASPVGDDALDLLERGEISAGEAAERLRR